MNKNFYEAVKERRSYYGLSKESTISNDRIKEIIKDALGYTPSALNSRTTRVVLLLNQDHTKLWDITKEALRKVVPADKFAPTEEKINSFEAGYGTVLFFEDMGIVNKLKIDFPTYAHNFDGWSQQTSGMHQFVVWTAFEMEGLGASLQHYNELIEEEVKKQWNIEGNWKLISQMPFGKPTFQPDKKEIPSTENTFKVFE